MTIFPLAHRVTSAVHHIELWVPDLDTARPRWEWLLGALGWTDFQDWPRGHSWKAADGSYLVIEESADMSGDPHDRLRPGLNHLALNAGPRATVDRIAESAVENGWFLLFADSHPFAGGLEHYAAYLVDEDAFEVELVAAAESS